MGADDEEPLPFDEPTPPLPLDELAPPLPPLPPFEERAPEEVVEPLFDEEPAEPCEAAEDSGVVAVVEVGVVAPGVAVPEGATVITWVGVALDLEEEALERPISTPTPIASSSTPTPAITVTALERAAPPLPETDPGANGGAGGAGVLDSLETPPFAEGGPPSSTLLIGVRRSPHSRQ